MLRNSASIEINRSIEDVFRLTSDHISEWSLTVVEDETLQRTEDGVGTTFRTVTEENGRRMTFEGIVTQWNPPVHNAVRMEGSMFGIFSEFRFESIAAGRTLVTQNSEVFPKGFFRIILLLFGWLMKKSQCDASRRELESLKRFCETYLGD